MPKRIKPAARRIPPKVYEATKKEFAHMMTYFYRVSNSDITSPIVIAPKATDPFVRLCGDYLIPNLRILTGNYPIPDVIKALHKIAGFTVFIYLDVTNSFHSI